MTIPRLTLLIVDDELYLHPAIASLLSPKFEVLTATGVASAKEMFQQHTIDIVLTDQRMPHGTGVELLEWVKLNSPKTVRLLMTGYAELEDAVEAINRGQVYYYLLKPWRTEELLSILHNAAERIHLEQSRDRLLSELKQLNSVLEERVQERTRELQAANRQLQQANHLLLQRGRELETLALTDPLTGLLNRRAVDDVAKTEINRHQRYAGNRLTIGVIDADLFKEINRRYLLPGGDQVLIALAKTLTNTIRAVDSVGRIGGEEFQVVAPETGMEGALVLGERIRSSVEAMRVEYKGERIKVTVSIGLVVADCKVKTSFEQMKHVAAQCLLEAKNAGRNRCVIRSVQDADPRMPTHSMYDR